MPEILSRIKSEKLVGLLFVLVLHGAALYGLWSYRIIPTTDEAITLMVNLINPPPPEQPKPPQPKRPQPEQPRPPKPQPIEPPPPEHQHLVVEAPVVQPDEPVAYAPPPPPSPPVAEAATVGEASPVAEAPALPPQPVMLSGDLSVSCPERAPPEYPAFAKRMNEQGKVVLRVELGEDGRVANATVKISSGHQRLDAAALNAVRTWRCKPFVRNGVAVRAVALQPFSFILEEK